MVFRTQFFKDKFRNHSMILNVSINSSKQEQQFLINQEKSSVRNVSKQAYPLSRYNSNMKILLKTHRSFNFYICDAKILVKILVSIKMDSGFKVQHVACSPCHKNRPALKFWAVQSYVSSF